MKALTILLAVSLITILVFSGCVQQQAPPPSAGDTLGSETVGLANDLDETADLQAMLEDLEIEDSGIDENSFE